MKNLLTFTSVFSEPGEAFALGLGNIQRQWDNTTNDFAKILNSPVLLFPDKRGKEIEKVEQQTIQVNVNNDNDNDNDINTIGKDTSDKRLGHS